jgi:hypothetical protein
MATDTMFEFMGVRVDPVDDIPGGELRKIAGAAPPAGSVSRGAGGYRCDGRLNDSFHALNLLLDQGVAVRRAARRTGELQPGDFLVPSASEALLEGVAKRTGVSFLPCGAVAGADLSGVKRRRAAIYQRYWGGNMDEGWTRLLLEQFGFPYASVKDGEIRKGGLNERYDVLILPDDSTARLTGEGPGITERQKRQAPPEYRSGFGAEGVKSLVDFVESGGTLVTLAGACNFAVEKFSLDVRDVTAGVSSKQFWCPGSTLRVKFDASHALAYGMPEEGLAVFTSGNPAFEILPGARNDRYEVAASYADRNLLASGWLIGEKTLARRAAAVAVNQGRGRIVLIGFRAQHRAQTHGTFKLVFNALIQ